MLDRDTVIEYPAEVENTVKAGKLIKHVLDPRAKVTIQDEEVTVVMYLEDFEQVATLESAELLEVRLTPRGRGQPFAPWNAARRLPLYLLYARAAIAREYATIDASLKALRELGKTRRGLGSDFYGPIGQLYTALVSAGEPYPVKALADAQGVDISTASRWIKEARQRGFIPEEVKS